MAVSMSVGHFPVGSKLLQKKWNERQLRTHQLKIASMKADIDNKNPLVHAHLRLKLKKLQLEEESQATVDNENKVLVDRISRIMRDRGRLDNWNEAYKPRSLNHHHRSSVATKIQGENHLLVRRLNRVKPLYDIRKWENDFNFHEYILHNMRATTKDYETIPMSKSPQSPSPTQNDERIRLPAVDVRTGNIKLGMDSPSRLVKFPKLNQKQENQIPRKVPEQFDPEKEAKLLYNSKRNIEAGDVTVLCQCLARRRFRERMQIREEYERMYDGERLIDMLRDNSHSSYKHILKAFLSRREAYDALTIRDALDEAPRGGAREATLIEVICTRHDLALQAIKKEYFNKYSSQLSTDIERMTSGQLRKFLQTLLSRERSSDLVIDQELAAQDAEELLKTDAEERWSIHKTDGRFSRMLDTEGYAQMRAAFVEYERISGLEVAASVSAAMEEENDPEYWHAVLAFVQCLRNCPSFFAESMRNSLKAIEKQREDENVNEDTNTWAEKTLIRCIVTRCEADLPQILRMYRKHYGSSLGTDIDLKSGLLYKDLLLEVIRNQGTTKKRQPNGKRVNGMIIRGPPPRNDLPVNRPAPVSVSPERLQKSPLNKGHAKPTAVTTAVLRRSNENRRGFSRRRGQNILEAATVQQARDFNPDKDADVISSALRIWDRDGHRTVLSILVGRSNDQRQKLRVTYANRHKRDLVTDLKKAVKNESYGDLLAGWLKTRVEFDATALYQAIMHGKQEVAMEILCTRPHKHIKNVVDAYRRLYGSTLTESIKDKLGEGFWQELLLALAQADRDTTNSVSAGLATSNATSLYEEEISGFGGSKFIEIFTKCNFSQIRATIVAFKKVSGKELQELIKNSPDASGEKKKAMDALVCCCKDPATYFCDKLHRHLTTEREMSSVCRIFISRAEVDLELMKHIYAESYGKALKSDLNSFCAADYKEFLNYLLSPQAAAKR